LGELAVFIAILYTKPLGIIHSLTVEFPSLNFDIYIL